jgi:pyrimidine-nucleoside phosphorylase
MEILALINKKKIGEELSKKEIDFIVDGITRNLFKDYQLSAWLMAVYLKGMSFRETVDLTLSMAQSGNQLSLSSIKKPIVDKHSTGGVGDKVTLIVSPILAALDLSVAKVSGRSLDYAGGTIDKLESIPGFDTNLSNEKFEKIINKIGLSITGQTEEISPADKKLYYLRDVTGTVDSIPLIASSIMSKKLATRSDFLILDVKYGIGSFCPTLDIAKELAKSMVMIGEACGRNVEVVISEMNYPLGYSVGNKLEILEAVEFLKGKYAKDIKELVYFVVSRSLINLGRVKDSKEAHILIDEVIGTGKALERFYQFVQFQGGEIDKIDSVEPQILVKTIMSKQSGVISNISAHVIGEIVAGLGAGRKEKEHKINHDVGIVFKKKIGEEVLKGEELLEVHYKKEDENRINAIEAQILNALKFTELNIESDQTVVAHITTASLKQEVTI